MRSISLEVKYQFDYLDTFFIHNVGTKYFFESVLTNKKKEIYYSAHGWHNLYLSAYIRSDQINFFFLSIISMKY